MRINITRSALRVALLFIAALAFSLSLARSVRAQLNPQYGRPSPIERDMRYRDWVLESMKKAGKNPDEKRQRLIYEQLREDFEGIQITNNEIVHALNLTETLGYKFISTAISDINKRAKRLDTNLTLPDIPKDNKRESQTTEDFPIKILLKALDGLIIKFVNNPIFKNVTDTNLQNSLTAKRDLHLIITLSDKIRKRVGELEKEGMSNE